MTRAQENELRQQAYKRGYNKAQIAEFISFAKAQEAEPADAPQAASPAPAQNRKPLAQSVVDFGKSVVKPLVRVGASTYNVAAGTMKALQGDARGANEEVTKTRNIAGIEAKPYSLEPNDQARGGPQKYLPTLQSAADVAGSAAEIAGFEGAGAGAKAGLSQVRSLFGKRTAKQITQATGRAPTMLDDWARSLEETNLRLTPVQKQKLGKRLNEVTDYITRKEITGTPQARLEKVTKIYEDTEDALQKFFAGEAKGVTAPKREVIGRILKLKSKYANERDVIAIERQIDGMANTVMRYDADIPVSRLNELKRSTYRNAYNKAGDKVLDEVEHDMADALRDIVERKTRGMRVGGKAVREFNREYGTLITAKKLLKVAETRNEVGLVGRLVASAMGGSLGSVFGPGIGTAVGIGLGERGAQVLAGTAARSGAAKLLKRLAR